MPGSAYNIENKYKYRMQKVISTLRTYGQIVNKCRSLPSDITIAGTLSTGQPLPFDIEASSMTQDFEGQFKIDWERSKICVIIGEDMYRMRDNEQWFKLFIENNFGKEMGSIIKERCFPTYVWTLFLNIQKRISVNVLLRPIDYEVYLPSGSITMVHENCICFPTYITPTTCGCLKVCFRAVFRYGSDKMNMFEEKGHIVLIAIYQIFTPTGKVKYHLTLCRGNDIFDSKLENGKLLVYPKSVKRQNAI